MLREIVEGAEVALYVSEKLDTVFATPYRAIGLKRDGEIVAGVIFNCFTGNDIEVTVAGTEFPRAFIRRMGAYCFKDNPCIRITITTEQDHVIDIAHRLGAATEGVKRNHFGHNRHGTILGLLKEDWKF